uniref:Uncharacterized protein n=1 Tax=Anguilla anguilla TaxID=7936 RepID=A0A0E9V410_ANGAN
MVSSVGASLFKALSEAGSQRCNLTLKATACCEFCLDYLLNTFIQDT